MMNRSPDLIKSQPPTIGLCPRMREETCNMLCPWGRRGGCGTEKIASHWMGLAEAD
ncbi:hypothetical protein Rcae01_05624 [Novipirellula caenicola]|uniref:Uncharacterized protein n=1 Tax=Novipirellula caenicola TaxID=1536901 RepID=A0ABP9VYA8_9BACT